MLNNKRVSDTVLKARNNISYQDKINIYDKKCKDCPYSKIKITYNDNKTEDISINELPAKALWKYSSIVKIERLCVDNAEEEYSLNEIIMNTCMLWS